MSSGESILSPSLIKLYGRTISEIQLYLPGGAGSGAGIQNLGANQFLKQQMDAPNSGLARIYGFCFEGHYHDLPKPVIMLVHGPGVAVAVAPTSIDEADEAVRSWEFAGGLSYWEYAKSDLSIKLGVASGTLEQILLEGNGSRDEASTSVSKRQRPAASDDNSVAREIDERKLMISMRQDESKQLRDVIDQAAHRLRRLSVYLKSITIVIGAAVVTQSTLLFFMEEFGRSPKKG